MRPALLVLAVLLAAGCGTGGTRTAAPPPPPLQAERLPAHLQADLRAIRREAAKVSRNSLMGTPGLQRTTGRFLDDLQRSKLGLLAQNRALDHAASAVAGSCDQCFQMVEAARPIPAIAH